MPYIRFTKIVNGKKKYCLKNKETGKVYCSDTPEKREKVARLHEMFKHIPRSKVRRYT